MKRANASFENERTRLGRCVRFLRLRAGLSQEDLADACGLDRTYVGGIERGERNPSLKNILKLASALDVALHELFNDALNAGDSANARQE
ncbi:helix-turn-helix domain-containing protein [Sphingobium sp. ba1]|jgi:transcriptional regulator with XRE-family HTH domain|uniref:helix-turn-helix domain-containing protein n=1 Tax=Sphingobium sp. ba1 TaxID=1522072 RepID=UPI00097152E9|nr:helix-turn-helix transcriptional regulator [Sphingobium sp. ba1]